MSNHEIGEIVLSPEGISLVASKEEEWSSCKGCYYEDSYDCPPHTKDCSEEPNVIFKVVPVNENKLNVLKAEVHNRPTLRESDALIYKLVQEKRINLEEFSILCSINRGEPCGGV